MKQSIFSQNSKNMLGVKSIASEKLINNSLYDSTLSSPSNSNNQSTNIFKQFNSPSYNQSNQSPKQVSSDRCLSINLTKSAININIDKSQEVRKSIFHDSQHDKLTPVNKQNIIDWVSGNSSIKFEDIMKIPIKSIKLTSENNSPSQAKIQSDQSQMDINVRRSRRNILKPVAENSLLNSLIDVESPQSKNHNQSTNSPSTFEKKNNQFSDYFASYESEQAVKNNTKYIPQPKNASKNIPSIDKIYREFMIHNSEPDTLKTINNTSYQNSVSNTKIIFKRDRKTSLGDIMLSNTNSSNADYQIEITPRRKNKFSTKTEKTDNDYDNTCNFNQSSQNKMLKETELDDDLNSFIRFKSNTVDMLSSKRNSLPSINSTSSPSKYQLYKSILKSQNLKMYDFFGELVDISKSPKSKRVSFAD